VYGLAVRGVQQAYRIGLRKVHRLSVPVVSVGNLTWGGTGKTPMVIHLARALARKGKRVAVLTRGYGQDEVDLLRKSLNPIPILAGADRVASGERAIREWGSQLLILDDGYQQWRLRKDVEILMVDATAPFGNGFLIPKGSLREPVASAGRADLMIVTKAELNENGLPEVEKALRRVNESAPIFLARYHPTTLVRWPSEEAVPLDALKGKRIAALSGIARPEAFEATLRSCGADLALKIRVADHHPYTVGELIRFMARCKRHGIPWLITTSKDAIRIPPALAEHLAPDTQGVEILVLEIRLEFTPDEGELLHRIDSLLAR
jgi:tetraacyldisaccharide 4'-kinase